MRKWLPAILVVLALFSGTIVVYGQDCGFRHFLNLITRSVDVYTCDAITQVTIYNSDGTVAAVVAVNQVAPPLAEDECNIVTVINAPESDALNLRADHNKDQSPWGQVFSGTMLRLTSLTTSPGDGFEFFPITVEGWVSAEWLDSDIVIASPPNDPLRLRAEPNVTSTQLGELYSGTRVEYMDSGPTRGGDYNWRHVSVRAWVATVGPSGEQLLERACG